MMTSLDITNVRRALQAYINWFETGDVTQNRDWLERINKEVKQLTEAQESFVASLKETLDKVEQL